MGVPYQVLPFVALLDLVATTIFSLHLGLLPTPQFLTINGASSISSFLYPFKRTAPRFASHTILIESANPKKLIFIMFSACVLRCSIIMLISSSIRKGIQAGRTGSRSEDYSDRAIGYSVTCIISILTNLSILNLLFQSRGAPANGSIGAIIAHMSASTLAAEQLIISAIEWILFLLVVGTNGLKSGPSPEYARRDQSIAAPSTSEQQQNIEPRQDEPLNVDQINTEPLVPPKDVVQENKRKSYGSLLQNPQFQEQQGSVIVNEEQDQREDEVSPTSSTSNDDSERPSAISSDIVDIPTDRKTSMQGARERLQRARENGKVRRRSIWKKIRGGKIEKSASETVPST